VFQAILLSMLQGLCQTGIAGHAGYSGYFSEAYVVTESRCIAPTSAARVTFGPQVLPFGDSPLT
jgi:hypothetical protein